MKVFSMKIIFFTNSRKFSPLKLPRCTVGIHKLIEVQMEHSVPLVQRIVGACPVVVTQWSEQCQSKKKTLGSIPSDYWLFRFPPFLSHTIKDLVSSQALHAKERVVWECG